MLNKIAQIFKSKPSPEQIFCEENQLHHDVDKGWIIAGVVLNDLSERLEYFSNRKLKNFDDLKELFFKALLINEKIDLEIATQRYVARLGNTEENLLELKRYISILNRYYKEFKRDR